MNIVLCGMMGAGKTSVGIKIADLTGMRWYDTDDLITEKYGRIPAIFEFYGENRFREMESEIVKNVSDEDNVVISTGGGSGTKPRKRSSFPTPSRSTWQNMGCVMGTTPSSTG